MRYLKRVLTILVFVLGLTGLLLAASFVFVPKNNMAQFGMEQVAANGILGEKENTVDVLVLGDSESYASITPMQIFKQTGYTSYVCGTGAQTLDYTTVLLHRAFEKQSPKIVILETNAIYREVSAKNVLISKLTNYFSVFQYHNRWKSLGWHDFTGKSNFTWTDDCKGYIYKTTVVPSQKRDHMQPTDFAAEIPGRNVRLVEQIHDFCEENGAKLVLVSTPSTINWSYARHNGIQALARDLGCEYLDLNLKNDQIQINWDTDTYDKGDHLNYSGAVKVTNYLCGYLTGTGLLQDHRDDPGYAKWHDSLQKYEALVGAA